MKVPALLELFRQARAGALALEEQIPIVNEFHRLVDGSPFEVVVGEDRMPRCKHVGGRLSYRRTSPSR